MLRTSSLTPNAENATPEELRVAMDAAPNQHSYIRVAAIRALLLGHERPSVWQLTKRRTGRPRKVKLERVRDLLVPVPRPWPERQNERQRQQFLEQLHTLVADPNVELWFADEGGVEGDPRPRRRWVQPCQPHTVQYLGDHIRQNVVGPSARRAGNW